MAQAVAPDARIVYADNDPVVLRARTAVVCCALDHPGWADPGSVRWRARWGGV
ncbi:MAG TPA: SAM-dependent methyltransferase [Streptosporangiaceae bacterium]|nr:SAM-dependent methyltransferase [Streptosporangiaceae bacterium]